MSALEARFDSPLPYLVIAALGAVHAYAAVVLMVLARKTGTPRRWMAWIPVANLWLLCRVGRRSPWWALGALVPPVTVVAVAVIWAGVARARQRSAWWGVAMLVPPINLLIPLYLAAGGAAAASAERPRSPAAGTTAVAARRGPGPRSCPGCGTRAGAADVFCGACGERLPVVR
jgi:hypothetical protein